MLTTGVDNIAGTAGNDTIIADNSGAAATATAGDQINGGAGTDTVKFYGMTAAQVGLLPQMTNVENLYFNSTATTANVNASAIAGVTSVELNANAGASNTVTVTTGQSVKLSANAVTNTTTVAGNTPSALSMTIDNLGQVTGQAQTIDFSGTALKTVSFTATGTKSSVSLTNTGTAIDKLTVAGDKSVTLTANAAMSAAVKTVDASANTGGVTYNATANAGNVNAAFAFTGGSGNDKLQLVAGDIAALTSGAQLKGGEGTDTLQTQDVTANFTAAWYSKVNAATGFEVLGMNGAGASAIDASQLTSIKSFSLDSNQVHTISNMVAGSSVAVTAAHANNITTTTGVGVKDLAFTVGTSNTGGITVGGTVNLAQDTVALSSIGTNAAANTITTLTAKDNSVYTITGSNDLTISAITAATATGSKYDASGFTGKLNITGNSAVYSAGSALGDVIIGGSGADTIKSSVNGAVMTGNGGNDTFDVSVALGGTTGVGIASITDFTKGDKIALAAGNGASAFTTAAVNLSSAASLNAALDLLAAGNGGTNSAIKWGVYQGNTYVVQDNTAGATFAATDVAVKLVGSLDLSTSTLATVTLTFA